MADDLKGYNPTAFVDLIGGDNGLLDLNPSAPKGVHSYNTGATPKYSTSIDKAQETMARMMIPFSEYNDRERFIKALNGTDARGLGEALAVTTESAGTKKGNGNGKGLGYIDFLLQGAQESYREKVQVVDVLSDNYIAYFFGQEPPVFSYQGTLLNTYQDDWRAAFSIIYSEIIRGTKLARRRRLLTLTYDNVAVTGTAVSMVQNLTADMEMAASFTLDILVKRYDVYRLPGTSEKGWNAPTPFTDVMGNLIDPNTFTGLKLGRVKKTYRVVGAPAIATSVPTKDKGVKTPSQQDALILDTSPAAAQGKTNVHPEPVSTSTSDPVTGVVTE